MTIEEFELWQQSPVDLSPDLSVIIPCFNERDRIVPTVGAIAAHLASACISFEIIVSDDGSTDGTPRLVRELGLRNVLVLEPNFNRGKGAAVRAGMGVAKGNWLLFSDADLSTPIEEVDEMLRKMREGADVVVGSRAATAACVKRGFLRGGLSAALRLLLDRTLHLGVADSQCGFKLFTARSAHLLFAAQQVDGFSFDMELLYLARQMDLRVEEHAVHWFEAPGSTVTPIRTSLGFLRDIVRIKLLHRRREPWTYQSGLSIGVVSSHTPSRTTLSEYGAHLVAEFAQKPEIGRILLFCEDDTIPTQLPDCTSAVPCWRFNSVCNPLRILLAARKQHLDAVYLNLHFTSFGGKRVAAAVGLMTPLLLRASGVRTIVILHNLSETVDLGLAGFTSNPAAARGIRVVCSLLTRLLLCANQVATTMPEYVDILATKYGATNVYLAPHGAFSAAAKAPATSVDGPPRILTFGRFGTYKRLEALLEAHTRLRSEQKFAEAELIVAGTSSPNAPGYIEGLSAQKKGDSGVEFLGYIPEDEVEQLFANCHIVVFPYLATTGSSGPLHQAGTYARAAVMPRIGDFIQLMDEEGFTGELFEPNDPESLCAAMRRLLVDPQRQQQMGHQNHIAAMGLPLSDVVDWHLLHLELDWAS